MWVQVPPLARFPPRAAVLAAFVGLAMAGCARFDEPQALGPPEAVLPRPDGPAVQIAIGDTSATAAFATQEERGFAVWAIDLADASAPRIVVAGPDPQRRHPPVAARQGRDGVLVAWRQGLPGTPGRIWSSSRPGAGGAFSPPRATDFPAAAGPRLGGDPSSLIAPAGPPARPGGSRLRPLALRQYAGSPAEPWVALADGPPSRPHGYGVLGMGVGVVVIATLEESGRLALSRHAPEGDTHTRLDAWPKGPGAVFLAARGEALLAAWSERDVGASTGAAVRTAHSTDAGRSWTEARDLWRGETDAHPLASFAARGSVVAAAWRSLEAGTDGILVARSTDGGASFAPAVRVDGGVPGRTRERPRVAVSGKRLLVAWQESDPAAGRSVRASLSDDLGRSYAARDLPVARASPGRAIRNPVPFLLEDGSGGLVWESHAVEARVAPARSGPPRRLSVHIRRLRR